MGMHYEVKVCINHKYDHFTGGKEVYDYLKQNINLQFNPFHNWMHDLVSNKWNFKEHKIKNITCLFIKRRGEKRYVERIIALKLQNCKVIDRKSLKVDKELIALGILYIIVILIYVFFEK